MDKLTKMKMAANFVMIVPLTTILVLHEWKILIGWVIGYIATLAYAVVREIELEEKLKTLQSSLKQHENI